MHSRVMMRRIPFFLAMHVTLRRVTPGVSETIALTPSAAVRVSSSTARMASVI